MAKKKERTRKRKSTSVFLPKILASTPKDSWSGLSPDVRNALEQCWRSGVPPIASALYARWWQFETWLRSLVYVELRAAKGAQWADGLRKVTRERQQDDEAFRYMPTPDAQATLAYADAADLFRIVEANWKLFEPVLFAHSVWNGNVVELLNIRNRIGHCRRPHADDLARLEQVLRNLETGAMTAVAAFNRQALPHEQWTDAVTDGWFRCQHGDAMRLVEHGVRQYGVGFELRWSRRPSSRRLAAAESISGIPGYLWHANWSLGGHRGFDVRAFWKDGRLSGIRDLIVFACVSTPPSSLEVSFPAVDDPKAIANAVGACFDAAIMALRIPRPMDVPYERWERWAEDLDPRVQVSTAWSDIGEGDPVVLFGA